MIEAASLDERISKSEKILKDDSSSRVFAPLADALRMKGKLDHAFRICRRGLRTHPDYGNGHLVMAKINFDRKMYDWAEQEIDEAVRLDGQTRASEQLRVEILISRGELDQARKLLGNLRAIGSNPLYVQGLDDRIKRLLSSRERRETERIPGGTSAVEASESTVRRRTYSIAETLTEITANEEVAFAVCAYRDGVVVEQCGRGNFNADEIAALGVEMWRAAESEEMIDNFGEPHRISADTDETTVMILGLAGYRLVLLCDRKANLGSLRLKLDEVSAHLNVAS
ncbi:MAG: hypothetical protein KAT58_08085 [candidate division Zixibacteria bacterium]|nr:hypothetical protein [candidate division Zixibacteria bacterium]